MDLNNINNQLADLTRDWERHQDAQHQYVNPEQQRRNEQIAAARQFIPPSTAPSDAIPHPSTQRYPISSVQTLPSAGNPNQQQQSSRPIYNPSQPQIIQTPPHQVPLVQLHQLGNQSQQTHQITAGHYQQLPQQVRISQNQIDPRADMNERMGNFRFDHAGSTYGMPSLVPVNMDHIYSGNLFSDGLPVPQDLRDQFTLSAPGQSQANARIQHQTKGKTMYRSDNNERLAALSPLGRALYYPVGGQFSTGPNGFGQMPDYPQPQQKPAGLAQQQYQQPQEYMGTEIDYSSSGIARPQQAFNQALQPQMNTRRSELRADINARMGQHPSLASASAPEAQYINMGSEPYSARAHNPAVAMVGGQVQPTKKVVYQDMYPVMSK
jgi:hypothetical protein